MSNIDKEQVILLVDGDTHYQMKNDSNGRKVLSNPDIKVMNMESDEFKNFKDKLNPTHASNSIYVLSPLSDGEYIELSQSKYKIPMDKIDKTIELCRLLGAKSVYVLSIESKDKINNKTAKATLSKSSTTSEVTKEIENNTSTNIESVPAKNSAINNIISSIFLDFGQYFSVGFLSRKPFFYFSLMFV